MDNLFEPIVAVLVGGTLIQLAPIKINPWTWIARKIGRAINGELIEKVDKLDGRLTNMEDKQEEREAKNARIRILRFGDECQHEVKHSQEHFDQIIQDIDQYETYCSEHPEFKNNKAALTISRIKENYKSRLKENDFL